MASRQKDRCKCGAFKNTAYAQCVECYKEGRRNSSGMNDDTPMEELEALIAQQRPTMPNEDHGHLRLDRMWDVATYRIVRLNRRWNGHYLT